MGSSHEDINYLLPVDVTLDSAAQLRSQAVQVDTLLKDLKATGAPARTVILDCCRDNPFGAVVKSWRPPSKSAVDGNVLRALGEVEIPEATMVVFASSSGRKAAARLNGDSTHSPFTAAFLEFIQSPGLSLRDIFDKVEDAVSEATGKRQTPVVKYGGSSRVFRDMVFLPAGPGPKPPPPRTVTPATASQAAPFLNGLGLEFVPVGTRRVLFCRTETRVRDFRAFASEKANATFASTQKNMEGYTMEKKGVDSYEWKLAGGTWEDPHFEQGEDHPVVCVSLGDAEAFAAWLTAEERAKGLIGRGDRYHLPTDDEWSAACGLGKYPWGSAWPPPADAGNFCGPESKTGPANVASWNVIEGFKDAYDRTAPVAQFAENKFGLYDLGGNVWEWCSSEYRKTMNTAEVRKQMPALENEKSGDGTAFRVLRGGSWVNNDSTSLLSSCRRGNHPAYRSDNHGFRLVLEVGSGG